MNVLATLGVGADGVRAMLIDPPDDVLSEAGRLEPRPTMASSLQVAEPALQIAWWPQQDDLSPESVSRLAWMLSAAGGGAGWLVSDGDEESPSREELRAAVDGSALRVAGETALEEGGFALHVAVGEE